MHAQPLPGAVPGFRTDRGFRDLGGLPTADGRAVRHGLLFRSSALHDLTDAEHDRLDALGLRFILDLRAVGETKDRKDYVPEGTEYLRVGGMRDTNGDEVDFSPEGIGRIADRLFKNPERFMADLYVSMAHGNAAVHELVTRFAQGQAPLLFHCTAGKDRTGVCAAVLLMALGVPDGEIMREFLLTNQYRASIINNPPADVSEAEREVWSTANSVRASDLQGVLDAVDDRHPTREDYLREEFGLDEHALADVRDRYLEMPTSPAR